MTNNVLLLEYAKEALSFEIQEAQNMLDRLDESIIFACRILLNCTGKVVVSGIGKSGHIGKKIAASLASTGTPAFFVHAAEALHGDLGMVSQKDVVIFISYSGRTYEIITLMPLLVSNNIPVIALTGDMSSPLAQRATCTLNIKIQRETNPMAFIPTSSAVNTLMMGDAITIALMRYRGFSLEQFIKSHPGGKIGTQLLNYVYHLMRTGKHISKVCGSDVTVMDAMFELSRTGIGLTTVCDDKNRVIGVFTDGDLRRWIARGHSLKDPINIAMTKPGYCISKEWHASIALKALYQRNITVAPVIDKIGTLVGLINIHDLHRSGINI
ncbi:arabinose-5-phosphate isomerase GutQ [Candidatus Blochmannia ocreatus (nom. nud.)]|uniref:Arabinose 5-phosphate isomerase n=1 Tax=Candidatus Blochmannia ocreatus (nom. nud.) TaxID=251538 RepID=A0ABY4SXA4_9ENTR|nr:arabinose-5-phosphate isomerase GutQ [Candidatus Blochmannia ocreatus]URJ25426.1 arabinose-5-phosphate isomerase GutQ [Candidatus Blochmannia ocreatus]